MLASAIRSDDLFVPFDSWIEPTFQNQPAKRPAQMAQITTLSPLIDDSVDLATHGNSAEEVELTLDAQPNVMSSLRHRIFELTLLSLEDNEPLPRTESLSGLNAFLKDFPQVSRPLLASDGEGSLVATWRIGQESMLSIRFLDRARIEFAWAFEREENDIHREWGEALWREFVSSFRYGRQFLGVHA